MRAENMQSDTSKITRAQTTRSVAYRSAIASHATAPCLETVSLRDAQQHWPLVMIGPGGDYTRRYVASGGTIRREAMSGEAMSGKAMSGKAMSGKAMSGKAMFHEPSSSEISADESRETSIGLVAAFRRLHERFVAVAHEIFTTNVTVHPTHDEAHDEAHDENHDQMYDENDDGINAGPCDDQGHDTSDAMQDDRSDEMDDVAGLPIPHMRGDLMSDREVSGNGSEHRNAMSGLASGEPALERDSRSRIEARTNNNTSEVCEIKHTSSGENHDESHPETTSRSAHDPQLASNAGLLPDDAGDRRSTRRQQGHSIRARRGAHREGSAGSRQEQGTLFVDCA